MVQSLAAAVKQGDPKALATMLNKSLAAKGIAVKVLRQGDRLHILLEAATPPKREALLPFLKTGLAQLQPEGILAVSVQGRARGQVESAWQGSFRLPSAAPELPPTPPPAPAAAPELRNSLIVARPGGRALRYKAKTSQSLTRRLLDWFGSPTGERLSLVAISCLLTSAFWIVVGGDRDSALGNLTESWSQRQLQGQLILVDRELGETGDRCYGTGGYDDVRAGMRVTVRDGRNQVLATGSTDAGYRLADSATGLPQCAFEFQVDLPNAEFYSIAIGRRGELSYSRAELAARDWQMKLTLDP